MKAIILAAGRGTRMRDSAESPPLSEAQVREADRGRKSLVPFHGHPFMAYLLSELADAGVTRVCMVVGPERDDPVRRAAEALDPERISLEFAVQDSPEGTAHALGAARDFALAGSGLAEPRAGAQGQAAGQSPSAARGPAAPRPDSESFLVVNADNLYPAAAIRTVVHADGVHATAGFRPEGLLGGTITRERLAAFALLRTGPEGCLEEIVEKPDARTRTRLGPDALVSMTLWRFGPEIFEACERIERSERGELELPDAVMHLVQKQGRCVRVVPVDGPVLDLTRRADIPVVERLLAGREPRP